ncbi:hypothetical protein NEMIN01_1813 [Nematocida minor]|uniref:uncharacterized protein n=1 Tax=Nematocida minor TaxID=1912983 RepID=UPI00221F981A|nr:uncharacterized protein NEMIN01_1813 [Nematocida minor]KAI5192117.1 hypothetical protein NEMIN01_1813 [Nematocida minor]
MKNQKIRKLLGTGTALLAFFITRCRGSREALNQGEDSTPGPSKKEKRVKSGITREYLSSIEPSTKTMEGSPMEDSPLNASNETTDPSELFQQYAAESSKEERASSLMDTSAETSKGKKRKIDKADEIDVLQAFYSDLQVQINKRARGNDSLKETEDLSCQQLEKESMKESKEQSTQDSPALLYEKEKIKEHVFRLWNSKRLKNITRKVYRSNHKTICIYPTSEEAMIREAKSKSQQIKLKEYIEDFFVHITPLVKKDVLWLFIAGKSPTINKRYNDLLGLRELFKDSKNRAYIKTVESLEGYYPGIIDDLIAYVKENQPMRTTLENPLTAWNQTVGDIYMQKHLDLNYCLSKEQEDLIQLEKKYHALAYAVRMIMILPEVYQDFSGITEDFIERHSTSNDPDVNQENRQILLGMHKLVGAHRAKKQSKKMYIDFYNTLKSTHMGRGIEESTAAELYREIYTLLAKFYENAEVVDKKANYILAGKCVIKSQKCMKCEMTVTMAPEDQDKRVAISRYSLEKHSWSVAPSVNAHYHVYYVDNALGQIKMLCMPIYKEDGSEEEHYLHTVSKIVEYIKTLYGIEKYADVIHPFKVNKKSRKWSYIKEKEERNKTVKELGECELVFYHIRHSLEEKFTFTEFRPKYLHEKGSICVPLFLTPLMRSAVELGPFTKKGHHEEIKLTDLENREPDVYDYNKKYKGKEYTDVQGYYKNLYILPDAQKKKNFSCYVMNCSSSKTSDGTVEAVWYVRVPSSVDEYTHCIVDKDHKEKRSKQKFNELVAAIESREYNKDSELQGFWLLCGDERGSISVGRMSTIYTWIVDNSQDLKNGSRNSLKSLRLRIDHEKRRFEEAEKKQRSLGSLSTENDTEEKRLEKRVAISTKSDAKKKLEILCKEFSKKPEFLETEFFVFRNANRSKSNMHAHNELLDIFIMRYNRQRSSSSR